MTTTMSQLSTLRKFMHPLPDDNWSSIASRELGSDDIAELQSWNLHVFMKAGLGAKEILPCDIIFLEPPLAV